MIVLLVVYNQIVICLVIFSAKDLRKFFYADKRIMSNYFEGNYSAETTIAD